MTTDPTEAAIRNAYQQGLREGRERAEHIAALELADGRLTDAIRALELAQTALVNAPAMYVTERELDALERRRVAVRAELKTARAA